MVFQRDTLENGLPGGGPPGPPGSGTLRVRCSTRYANKKQYLIKLTLTVNVNVRLLTIVPTLQYAERQIVNY